MTEVCTAPSQRLIDDLRQKPLLIGLVLILATVLLYAPVSHHEFLKFDDDFAVTDNDHVRTGFSLSNVAWAFTSVEPFYWQPVTWLSHMLDCQLFGLNAGAHHCTNVLLHAANVLLVFLLLQRGTGAFWRSFGVAFLFAVHPLNVENVAWVAERKSLLSVLFSLLTIAVYGWYAQRPNYKKYLAVAGTFSLALMSKPMAVSLPLVLLLIDHWPLRRYEQVSFHGRWTRLFLEKLPLLLMSAATSVVTSVGQRSWGAVVPLSQLPLSVRLQNAVTSYVAYIGKMFWPAKLAIFYPHPAGADASIPAAEVIASAAVLAGITLLLLKFRRFPWLTMGWFWFVITLAPVIGVVQVGAQAMADRFAYVPLIGLFLIVIWSIGYVVDAASLPRVLAPAACVLVIAALSCATRNYLRYWQNGVELFTRARNVVVRPDFVIEELLADSLYSAARFDEALPHYRTACGLRPRNELCHYNAAEILFKQRQLRAALEEYQLARTLTANTNMVLSCLNSSGEILSALGEYDAAETQFATALQIDPRDATAARLYRRVLILKANGTQ